MRLSGITEQRMLWGIVRADGDPLVHMQVVGGMRWPTMNAVALLSPDEARAIGAALLEAAGAGLDGYTHVHRVTVEGCDPDAFARGLMEFAARARAQKPPGEGAPPTAAAPELYDQELKAGHKMSGLVPEPPLGMKCGHPNVTTIDAVDYCDDCGRFVPRPRP